MQQMSGEPEPLMKWLVDKHNEQRYRHGVQLLTWDWSLAWNAYNYVVGCPKGHSGQQGIGENLAWGHNDFNHAMRDWYDEVSHMTVFELAGHNFWRLIAGWSCRTEPNQQHSS
jgi:hypothetical protein